MAILKFRIYWEEDDSVYRDIVIRHTQTFFELHETVLKSFEFDQKHNATFYRSNDKLQRGKEITLEQYEKVYKAPPLLMNETTIGSEIRDPNQKFIYVYDFHKLWTFLVELIHINKDESHKVSYPSCVRSEGFGPSQYGTKGLIKEKESDADEKYDLNTTALTEGYGEEGAEAEEAEDDSSEEEEI